jgi:hypothetical protein
MARNGCACTDVSINYVVFMADFSVQIVGRWVPNDDQKCYAGKDLEGGRSDISMY